MLFLRSLVFQILFFLNMFGLMIIWLPAMPMRRQINQELGRTWGRANLWLLDKICGLKIDWRGLENIPKGAVIVACKHQSIWETFVLPIKFPDFSYILKHELIWLPFFGWYLLAAEQIAIDRAKGGKLMPQLIAKSKKIFTQGRQLFIFPEGTRRPAGAPPQYRFGVAQLYAATGYAGVAGCGEFGALLAAPVVHRPAGNGGDRIPAADRAGNGGARFFQSADE